MTPSARLAAAAAILDGLDWQRPADPQLKAWARANRYAGSGDRRAIQDRVYSALRRRRSFAAQGGATTGRGMILGGLRLEDRLSLEVLDRLCGGGYGLAPLNAAERSILTAEPIFPSDAARLDWPDWLWPAACQAFGADVEAELSALRERAPLDLRVNTLQGTVVDARKALADEGLVTLPIPLCETALRLPPGSPVLNTAAYRRGLVELQDSASQAVSAIVAAEPGQRVLDFCAGAGGKTLALAAAMRNSGTLDAHDVEPRRMEALDARAQRSGVTIIQKRRSADLIKASYDVVLVDAPCSGSGSWRRDPMGKWRLTAERLAELNRAQDGALSAAADCVRPGGRLVYATCSVLTVENQERVAAFTARRPEFEVQNLRSFWPARDGADGFFVVVLQRSNSFERN